MTRPTAPPSTLSPDELSRIQRVDRLLLLEESPVPPLLAMLTDPSWAVRRAVISALAARGDEASGPLCAALATEREDETRIAAVVDALVACTGPSTDATVIQLGELAPPAVVADVAQILGRRRSVTSVPLLVELAGHADDNVAVASIEALGRIGGRAAVEALVETVKTGGFFRAFPAIDVLGRSGDPRVVEPLAALLTLPHLATEAARALGRSGERHATAPLASLLLGPSDAMARIGATALLELEQRHAARVGYGAPITAALRELTQPAMARRLIRALTGADAVEQVAIAWVLGVLGGAEAVVALVRLLDADATVAEAAARALSTLAEVADAELVSSLVTGDPARRLILLPLLSRRSVAAAVAGCLEDSDPRVRVAACEALARIGATTETPALFRVLVDANPRVAHAAVAAIQAIGGPSVERLALGAAGSEFASTRGAAIRILSYFGWAGALPVLLRALDDDEPRVADAAIQGLPFIQDPRALDELLRLARDPHHRKRASAARALGRCRDEIRVTSMLLRLLGDGDAWARYYACQSLGRLGVEAAAQAITRLLEDPAGQVRVAAIEALSHLRSEVAFEALRTAVRSTDPDVHRAALVGLGISRRPEAEPVLIEAVRSNDPSTRLVAIAGIADFEGSDAVLAALTTASDDPDEAVRNAAIGFLASRAGALATDALIARLAVGADTERLITALALPVEGRAAALEAALVRADDQLAPFLVAALARMRRPEADQRLRDVLVSGQPPARKAAATAVAAQSEPTALVALRRAATDDPDVEVRRIAVLLLAQ